MYKSVVLTLICFISCNNEIKLKEFQKSGDVLNFETHQFERNYPTSKKTIELKFSEEDLKIINEKLSEYKIASINQTEIVLDSNVNINGYGYFLRFDNKELFVDAINSDFYHQNPEYLNLSIFLETLDSIIYSKDEILKLEDAY